MLCRVLFVAAVVSYVLCVLLLSGVQKDELDAATLRKLQRHNVNIDAIGDRKLPSQCITENNSATTLTTLPVKLDDETKKPTMKPTTYELDTQSGDSPAQWDKLLTYLKQKKDQSASNLRETTMQPIIIQSDSNTDTLPSPIRSHFIEDIIGRVTKIPEQIVKKNKKEKARYVLQNSAKSQSESSTANDNTINERSNDVEYIRKIVAEILSQRQPEPVQASTALPIRTFNANKLVEDIDKMLKENKANDQTNYSLMTITEKQEKTPDYNKSREDKEKREIIEDFFKQFHNPISNLRNSLIDNVQTEMKQGKVTLYNARDKLSDMLNIVKNEPNNLLYVIGGKSIKPIESEPLADQKLEVHNQLSERDKAFLCKSNNEIHLIQKDIYRYICPYDQSSKLTGVMPEEQINLQFSRQNERDQIGSSKPVNNNYFSSNDNKTIWPYFFENQNNGKDQKIEMDHNSLDIKLPSERYEPMKPDDPGVDDAYKSKRPYFLERQRNTEELYHGNPNLLFNQLNDRGQAANVKIEAGKIKTNTFANPHYPLDSAEVTNRGSDFKSKWAFNVQSVKEFEPKLDNEQENPYPSFNGEFKNTWPYFSGDIRVTQNPIRVDKNALYRKLPDRENNQKRMLLGQETSVNSRLDKREKVSKLLSRDNSEPKFLNWYDMKGHDIKDNKSTGTLGYIAKEQQKKSIPGETTNAKNNVDPNNYETINWPYLIERQKAQLDLIATEENKKEPLYPNDSKIPKRHNYEYALKQNDEEYNKLLMNTEARGDFYQQHIVTEISKNDIQRENNEKVKSLPLDVLIEIANTVKEIVLKDLKTETPVTSTTTETLTTTPATPITTTTMTPTTITTTTITSSTITTTIPVSINVIKKTEPRTTTDTLSTKVKDDPMKIQEASEALKNFMELFEKFNLMKNGNQNPNVTQKRDNITQTQRAVVIATVPKIIRNPYAPYTIATMPTIEPNLYAPIKFYAPLLPPMSPYGIRSPYLQTKAMVLDPYLQKIIQVPATIHKNALDNMHTVGRSAHALTFQTNSNEIKPLKIPVSKGMIVDNIVLSPKPPRDRGRHLREYSEETYKYRKPNKHTQRNEYSTRSNRSRDSDFEFDERPKPRSMKKEYRYNDRFNKPRTNYEGVRFHEKLEKEDNWARSSEGKCGSKEGCDDRVVPRQQRPLINIASTYDDTHFQNFLKTQQKVNDMLERILATKTKLNRRSGEVI